MGGRSNTHNPSWLDNTSFLVTVSTSLAEPDLVETLTACLVDVSTRDGNDIFLIVVLPEAGLRKPFKVLMVQSLEDGLVPIVGCALLSAVQETLGHSCSHGVASWKHTSCWLHPGVEGGMMEET